MSPRDLDSGGRASVRVVAYPLWRIRLARGLPRYLLYAVSLAGLLASARFAIVPPKAEAPPAAQAPSPALDRAAEGYAALFARRYLTWDASEPLASARALEQFTGPGVEAGAGLRLPASGEQHVQWLEVVQQREPAAGEHTYTLAAQTDSAGLLYVTVTVVRGAGGSLGLAGYPAIVGPPTYGPATATGSQPEVLDPLLGSVVERALRNYLAGSTSNLAADLTSGARVSAPRQGLALQSLGHLHWTAPGSSLQTVVQAQDARGVQYALQYELDVARVGRRWEISAIQMDPSA
jgi:Conjugative transposon protein TcpC